CALRAAAGVALAGAARDVLPPRRRGQGERGRQSPSAPARADRVRVRARGSCDTAAAGGPARAAQAPRHPRSPARLPGGVMEGDLRGLGIWTLTGGERATHVRFDWEVHADRPLLRYLTPLLRPLFRWNHNWAIARAIEGLEPYARRTRPGAPPP